MGIVNIISYPSIDYSLHLHTQAGLLSSLLD